MKTRVYVIDDNTGLAASLKWFIESAGYHVRTYSSAQDFLSGFDRTVPGCLILDVKMPGMSGLELQRVLKKEEIKLPIIFMTGHANISSAVSAIKAGALDFLMKPANTKELLALINRALALDLTRHTEEANKAEALLCAATLTAREREVLALVVRGNLTKTIATHLGLSHRTVEMHRANIMRKMHVHNQVELTYVVLSHCAGFF